MIIVPGSTINTGLRCTTFWVSLILNSSIGVISWTPTNSQVGDNSVIVTVSDGNGGSDTQSFTVVVSNVNDPPEITSTPVTLATVDTLYSYDVDATDPDIHDVLTYRLIEVAILMPDIDTYTFEWLDLNNNGIFDPGEPWQMEGLPTDATGGPVATGARQACWSTHPQV